MNGNVIQGVFPPVHLQLEPYPPSAHGVAPPRWPPAGARPRIVSNLPPNFTSSRLFDTFRGYGPLASARMQPSIAADVALLEFWREDDARRAEEIMHCTEIDDFNISVQLYQPPRKQDFNPSAPAFVPSGMYPPRMTPSSPPSIPQSPLLVSHIFSASMHTVDSGQYSPPRAYPRSPSIHGSPSLHGSPFLHGPGQQVQFAPPLGPGSSSASGLIDPCNLFIKDLEPEIDSNALFTHFRRVRIPAGCERIFTDVNLVRANCQRESHANRQGSKQRFRFCFLPNA